MAPPKKRVHCFVDGFNLYHRIDDFGRDASYLKWNNLFQLMKNLLDNQNQSVEKVYYFTAMASHLDARKVDRHNRYIQANILNGVNVIKGSFKYRKKKARVISLGTYEEIETYEEKETDVNIATYLLKSAYSGQCDVVAIVTGDTDIVPPMKLIKSELTKIQVISVLPPQHAKIISPGALRGNAHKSIQMTRNDLEKSLLPEKVTDKSGKVVMRPVEYAPPK